MPSKKTMKVSREVLSYFLRFPEAADNLEGIARWRLMEERIHSTLEETRGALDWLSANGFLVREETASAQAVYHLNASKRDEAKDFLERKKQ